MKKIVIFESLNTFFRTLKVIFTRRMIISFVMGFSSGIPLLLTLSTLQAWMKDEKVDLTTIGLISLLGLPYTLKFVWSPILDRFRLPLLGRRRGWLLLFQVLLMLSIFGIGLLDPVKTPYLLVFVALSISFFSASQDIVVDAYRREDLADEELGLGSSLYVNGYRLAMLVSGAGALALAEFYSWGTVYMLVSATMLVGIIGTLLTPEPVVEEQPPRTIKEAVIDPFVEYFAREDAWLMLAFILLYKIGDTMALNMTMPFYLSIGFTKLQIAIIAKSFGFAATIVGTFLGGLLMLRLGINRSLWIFGGLQMITTFGFAILYYFPGSSVGLALAISAENLAMGMGTAAFLAFMASLTNKKFTATQYALMTSLMGIPRVIIAAPTGYIAKATGWPLFFVICALLALPGLFLLSYFAPYHQSIESSPVSS